MKKKKAIRRPMYKTDVGFRKGMEVLVDVETDKIIAKHFDIGKLGGDKIYESYEIIILKDIDWELAGYNSILE